MCCCTSYRRIKIEFMLNLFYTITMKQINPYPYAFDNKRYTTFTYYCHKHYGSKVVKLPLQLGFTCPNRDGSKGFGGCSFCNAYGSGEFNKNHQMDIVEQYIQAKERYKNKWTVTKTMPYFQSFTNTYCSVDHLQEKIEALNCFDDEIVAYAIATRCDCINDDMLHYLSELNKSKEVWVELGFQTSNDTSKQTLNCLHTNNEFIDAMTRLKNENIKTCIHIINGLPDESEEDMLNTVKFVNSFNPTAVKFTMLHILDNAPLGKQYLQHPWTLLTQQQYLDILCKQLQYLSPSIIIERICGDGDANHVIAPDWTRIKISTMNELDKKMAKENIMQGQYINTVD